jgi:hypothetical protein
MDDKVLDFSFSLYTYSWHIYFYQTCFSLGEERGIWCLHLFDKVKILNFNFITSEEYQALGFFTPEEMKSLV